MKVTAAKGPRAAFPVELFTGAGGTMVVPS